MGRRSGFRLTKYYLDCITASGAAYIGYSARLRWGLIDVSYAALLESDESGSGRERQAFTGATDVEARGGTIAWACPKLGVAGRWEATAPPEDACLLDTGHSRIDWAGLAPRAACELRLDGGTPVTGTGYVERLDLTVLPWRLPFDTLHWGRYHGQDDVLYWIAWDGETRLRHARLDGRPLGAAEFAADAIRFGAAAAGGDDVVLRFLQTRTLRRAPIVTSLESLPALLRRVPSRFHSAEEEKWVSRACLSAQGRKSSGWALHEQVRLR